jgi:hypothetical protein
MTREAKEGDTGRGAPATNGQPPSDEYKRMESLMKRLVAVPKKVIAERKTERERR